MGGEKSTGLDATSETIGSPPRGRGKGANAHRAGRTAGITPAWAGKSRRCCLPGSPRRDHPRMGGEKTLYSGMQQVVLGSSPRWRGKDRFLATQSLVLRITPAWAGKSSPLDYTSNLHTDHPRVGGEKAAASTAASSRPGSPPRRRGKGVVFKSRKYGVGITPA